MLPPLSLLCPAQRIWPANETMSFDRASATCVCVNTHTVVCKCCTSLLYYLDNCSTVGVMAINTWLHHNTRKLVFGEKTTMRQVL